MSSKPLVSAIIPVYNGAAFLRETLQSVFAQQYDPIEVIVVDDGSNDGSLEILSEYGNRLILIKQFHQGVAVARNTGLARAQGKYIALIDHDDLWLPEKTKQQVDYLEMHPDIEYVLSRYRMFLSPGAQRPGWVKPELLHGDHAGYLLGTMLARRSVFNRVGDFDSQYRNGTDDVAWFFKAKDMQISMKHLLEVCLDKRIHGNNASSHVSAMHRDLLHIARQSAERQRQRELI